MLEYFPESQQRKIHSECYQCGNEIYIGDDYYDLDGRDIHEDCIEDYLASKKKIAEVA